MVLKSHVEVENSLQKQWLFLITEPSPQSSLEPGFLLELKTHLAMSSTCGI